MRGFLSTIVHKKCMFFHTHNMAIVNIIVSCKKIMDETRMIHLLVQHCDNVTILNYNTFEYKTSRKLLSMGIGCCCQCGLLIPSDARWCGRCASETIIIPADAGDTQIENPHSDGG